MRIEGWKLCNVVFTMACSMLTVVMSGFWLYQFALNEDLSTLEYKYYYSTEEDMYPSMSLCFKSPFDSRVSKEAGVDDRRLVESYLLGHLRLQKYNLNHKNLTLDLTKYLMEYWIMKRNGSEYTFKPSNYKWKAPYVSYRGFRGKHFYKCFGIEIPEKDIQEVSVKLSNKIFPNKTRPTHWGFLILLHYPNQLHLPSTAMKYIWPPQTNQNDYEIRFYAENLEIYRRRKNCHFNSSNYDEDAMKYHFNKLQCRPLYDHSSPHLPVCTEKEQVKELISIVSLHKHSEFPPPCKAMEKINYKYEIIELTNSIWEAKGSFWCTFIVQETRFKVSSM